MKALFSSRNADVFLAIAVAGIIGAMIVPLPPWVLDAFIALNLAASATLLVAALYAKDALKVAAFPTLLLITTLFRLALNVSSTRLALLEAHAGEVIQAFGEFVLQGDYVVGGVVFAILTLVQFLVVAKGAERVAEVGARFTLDAMPGKQMSIDADLRAGAIDMDGARKRRRMLERESQLYGAMDGAMKFVKGDAIAGLIIVLINAVGGLIIGVVFKGMSGLEAARTYTLLAIGDGLVSQIPALCIAISAGLVVTRVAAENDGEASLGADIGSQFFSQPKALGIVAGLLALLGLMPMMPKVPFFALSLACALGAWKLATVQSRRAQERQRAALEQQLTGAQQAAAGGEARPAAQEPAQPQVGVAPICLDLDASLDGLARANDSAFIRKDLGTLREALYAETGVRFPGIRARGQARLGKGAYAILVDEVPAARGAVEPDAFYAGIAPDEVAYLGIQALPYTDPSTGLTIAQVDAASAEKLRALSVVVRTAGEQVLSHAAHVLRRHARSFLGIQEVQALLDALEKASPALVREATQKVPTPLLTDVLRRLVDEGVSIRNLRGVLEALTEPTAEGDALTLAERCRVGLRRYLSHRYASDGTLVAYLADPEVEELMRAAVKAGGEPGAFALAPEDASAILEGVRSAVGDGPEAVVLASPDVRRYLRKLIEGTFPEVAVLTFTELVPDLKVRPIGRIPALREAA